MAQQRNADDEEAGAVESEETDGANESAAKKPREDESLANAVRAGEERSGKNGIGSTQDGSDQPGELTPSSNRSATAPVVALTDIANAEDGAAGDRDIDEPRTSGKTGNETGAKVGGRGGCKTDGKICGAEDAVKLGLEEAAGQGDTGARGGSPAQEDQASCLSPAASHVAGSGLALADEDALGGKHVSGVSTARGASGASRATDLLATGGAMGSGGSATTESGMASEDTSHGEADAGEGGAEGSESGARNNPWESITDWGAVAAKDQGRGNLAMKLSTPRRCRASGQEQVSPLGESNPNSSPLKTETQMEAPNTSGIEGQENEFPVTLRGSSRSEVASEKEGGLPSLACSMANAPPAAEHGMADGEGVRSGGTVVELPGRPFSAECNPRQSPLQMVNRAGHQDTAHSRSRTPPATRRSKALRSLQEILAHTASMLSLVDFPTQHSGEQIGAGPSTNTAEGEFEDGVYAVGGKGGATPTEVATRRLEELAALAAAALQGATSGKTDPPAGTSANDSRLEAVVAGKGAPAGGKDDAGGEQAAHLTSIVPPEATQAAGLSGGVQAEGEIGASLASKGFQTAGDQQRGKKTIVDKVPGKGAAKKATAKGKTPVPRLGVKSEVDTGNGAKGGAGGKIPGAPVKGKKAEPCSCTGGAKERRGGDGSRGEGKPAEGDPNGRKRGSSAKREHEDDRCGGDRGAEETGRGAPGG